MPNVEDQNDPFTPPTSNKESTAPDIPCTDFDDGFGDEVNVSNDEVKFGGMIESIKNIKAVLAIKTMEIKNLVDVITPMIGRMGTADLLFLFRTLEDLEDVGSALKSAKEKQGKFIGRRLNDVLTSGKISSINYEGFKFTPIFKSHFNVLAADRAAFLDEMKKEAETAALVTENVHHNTLSAYCNNLVENGKPLPKYVSEYKEPTVNMRKIPSKSK